MGDRRRISSASPRPIRLAHPCRLNAALVPAARAASLALAALDDPDAVTDSHPSRPSPEPAQMAAKKVKRNPPAPASPSTPKVDQAVVRQVGESVLARLESEAAPPGVVGAPQAALFGGKGGVGGLKKLVNALVPALVKAATIAKDGQIDAAEIAGLVQDGVDLIKKWMVRKGEAPAGGPDGTPAPAA